MHHSATTRLVARRIWTISEKFGPDLLQAFPAAGSGPTTEFRMWALGPAAMQTPFSGPA